jgi:hypothetical protein
MSNKKKRNTYDFLDLVWWLELHRVELNYWVAQEYKPLPVKQMKQEQKVPLLLPPLLQLLPYFLPMEHELIEMRFVIMGA